MRMFYIELAKQSHHTYGYVMLSAYLALKIRPQVDSKRSSDNLNKIVKHRKKEPGYCEYCKQKTHGTIC